MYICLSQNEGQELDFSFYCSWWPQIKLRVHVPFHVHTSVYGVCVIIVFVTLCDKCDSHMKSSLGRTAPTQEWPQLYTNTHTHTL